MKKKSPQVKVPLKKIVFFSLIVALAGFALLFFSIAFGGKTPKTPAPPAPAEKPSESIPPDSVPQKPFPISRTVLRKSRSLQSRLLSNPRPQSLSRKNLSLRSLRR